jgi:hypothetical protein
LEDWHRIHRIVTNLNLPHALPTKYDMLPFKVVANGTVISCRCQVEPVVIVRPGQFLKKIGSGSAKTSLQNLREKYGQ